MATIKGIALIFTGLFSELVVMTREASNEKPRETESPSLPDAYLPAPCI